MKKTDTNTQQNNRQKEREGKEGTMNQTSFNIWTRRGMTILAVSLFWGAQHGFAWETSSNITLDDHEAHSPQVILTNGNNKKLILQKLASGEARILNNGGNICFVPSNSETDSICFDTTQDKPAIILSDGSTNKVSLKTPSGISSDFTLTLPNSEGSRDNVLKTDGDGNLGWIDVTSVVEETYLGDIDQALITDRTIDMNSYTLTIDGTGANLILPDESIDTEEIAKNAVTSSKLDNSDYYAPGALSSFGYHTNDCVSTERFVHMETFNNTEYGLCVETTRRPQAMWGAASNTCKMAGKRLLDYIEWRKACDGKIGGNSGTVLISGMTDGQGEWASSRPAGSSHTPVSFDWNDYVFIAGKTTKGAAALVAGLQEDGIEFYYCAAVAVAWVRGIVSSEDGEDEEAVEGSEGSGYHFRCVR